MVSIEFHKPTDIVMHGITCKVLKCECLYYVEIGYYYHLFFGSFDDNCLVAKFKIKSIKEI